MKVWNIFEELHVYKGWVEMLGNLQQKTELLSWSCCRWVRGAGARACVRVFCVLELWSQTSVSVTHWSRAEPHMCDHCSWSKLFHVNIIEKYLVNIYIRDFWEISTKQVKLRVAEVSWVKWVKNSTFSWAELGWSDLSEGRIHKHSYTHCIHMTIDIC